MTAARATLICEIGDLREQYLDLLELVEMHITRSATVALSRETVRQVRLLRVHYRDAMGFHATEVHTKPARRPRCHRGAHARRPCQRGG